MCRRWLQLDDLNRVSSRARRVNPLPAHFAARYGNVERVSAGCIRNWTVGCHKNGLQNTPGAEMKRVQNTCKYGTRWRYRSLVAHYERVKEVQMSCALG